MRTDPLKKKYAAALETLIQRKLTTRDGLAKQPVLSSERRLKLKLPGALKTYYEVAGKLAINTEHNRLYLPKDLRVRGEKLLFMEENQRVVFWGMDRKDLNRADPEVFQAANTDELIWYSEGLSFSEWIIKMWRWQAGLDPGL